MSTLLTDAELVTLQGLYPSLQIKPFTAQQETLVTLILKGVNVPQAEKQAGYRQGGARIFLKKEETQTILEWFRDQVVKEIKFTRDQATMMYLEAHGKAASATEEIMATKELCKLHDLNLDAKHKGTNIQINDNSRQVNVSNAKQLERMDTAKLMELAGMESLDPIADNREPVTIDGDTGQVEDD